MQLKAFSTIKMAVRSPYGGSVPLAGPFSRGCDAPSTMPSRKGIVRCGGVSCSGPLRDLPSFLSASPLFSKNSGGLVQIKKFLPFLVVLLVFYPKTRKGFRVVNPPLPPRTPEPPNNCSNPKTDFWPSGKSDSQSDFSRGPES